MSIALVHTRADNGLLASLVSVEVHLSRGLPGFSIVGLAATAVKESRDRVRSAIINSGFEFPVSKIIVNLAPADLPKQGGRFDLPIAIGILAASRQIRLKDIENLEFAGELSLAGEIGSAGTALPLALATKKAQRQLVISTSVLEQVKLVTHLDIIAAKTLKQLVAHLNGEQKILPYFTEQFIPQQLSDTLELHDVIGQPQAKRALQIAACGGHSLLMTGPPGTGKSMLASRLPGLLPALSEDEAITIAAIQSLAQQDFTERWGIRPFRAPHHTTSHVAMVGGGRPPRPGEISLAHLGILFLDELPEFSRLSLEALREPLETKHVTIARAGFEVSYPANFQLIAAMNPCPCGYAGDGTDRCRCQEEAIQRYRQRISGPLLERIDLSIQVERLDPSIEQQNGDKHFTTQHIHQQATTLRQLQLNRQGCVNALLSANDITQHCAVDTALKQWLQQLQLQNFLSMRVVHKILRVARTIADIEQQASIAKKHVLEALSLRV